MFIQGLITLFRNAFRRESPPAAPGPSALDPRSLTGAETSVIFAQLLALPRCPGEAGSLRSRHQRAAWKKSSAQG
jgi:hypothetical protein